jgi:hypothetical protein
VPPCHSTTLAAAPRYPPTVAASQVPVAQQAPGAPFQQAQGVAVPPYPAHAQMAHLYQAPTQTAWPAQPAAGQPLPQPPVPGNAPARRRRTGVILGCVAGALVLAVAVAVIDHLGRSGPSGQGGDAKASGAPATGGAPTSTGPSASGRPTGSMGDVLAPASYRRIELADGYGLRFADRPLGPRHAFEDLSLTCGGGTCSLVDYGIQLALLDRGEQGSLNTCRHETRFLHPAEGISVSRLSKGRQLCATTPDGTIALVTFESRSPSTSATQYVTLDVTVWGVAVAPTD